MTVMLTPNSKGLINIKARNPVWGSPLICPGYLITEPDIKRIIQGIRIEFSIFNNTSIKKNTYKLADAPMSPCDKFKFNSDAYWTCVSRQQGGTINHSVRTCKMGPEDDFEAVVVPTIMTAE